MNDRWFAVVTALVIVLLLGSAVVAVAYADEDAHENPLEPPDVHDETPPADEGVATLDGQSFDSVQAALDAANPGDTVVLAGRFDERIVIETPDITLRGADGQTSTLIDGGGAETIVEISAENVTIQDVWLRNSGFDPANEEAAVFVDGADATLANVRMTEVTYGVWVNGVSGVTIEETTIVGRAEVTTLAQRGNGIHLWEANDAVIRNNTITDARDGIYFAWAEQVVAEGNVLWNLRYGVHYMYSSDNRLAENLAFGNDIGFALMISDNLTIERNVAADNRGPSGHGILLKEIDRSVIRENHVVRNGNGFFVYNAQDNRLVDNLVLGNQRGIHVTAGSHGKLVAGNSFIDNAESAYVDTRSQVVWNDSERGNYWSDARPIDLDHDGTSDVHHRPAGTVERLVIEHPHATVFAQSPAFDVVRVAESAFPVLVTPGAVDHHPLVEPNHGPEAYDEDHH